MFESCSKTEFDLCDLCYHENQGSDLKMNVSSGAYGEAIYQDLIAVTLLELSCGNGYLTEFDLYDLQIKVRTPSILRSLCSSYIPGFDVITVKFF